MKDSEAVLQHLYISDETPHVTVWVLKLRQRDTQNLRSNTVFFPITQKMGGEKYFSGRRTLLTSLSIALISRDITSISKVLISCQASYCDTIVMARGDVTLLSPLRFLLLESIF